MSETIGLPRNYPYAMPALVAGTALLVNAFSPDFVRRPERTHITGDNTELIALAGLNHQNADGLSSYVSEQLEADCSSLHYSSKGFKIKDIALQLTDFYGGHDANKSTNVVCQSLGSLVLLKSIAHCAEQNWHLPKIDNFIAISSPLRTQDVFRSQLYKVPKAVHPRIAGMTGKMLGEFVTHLRDSSVSGGNLKNAALYGLSSYSYGASPSTWHSTLGILYDNKHDIWQPKILDKSIDSNTTISYIYDPEDKVVDTRSALKSFQDIATVTGANIQPIEVTGMGHARFEKIGKEIWDKIGISAPKLQPQALVPVA